VQFIKHGCKDAACRAKEDMEQHKENRFLQVFNAHEACQLPEFNDLNILWHRVLPDTVLMASDMLPFSNKGKSQPELAIGLLARGADREKVVDIFY
jgi:hypothetical protein